MENQIEIEEINTLKRNDIEDQQIISVNKIMILSFLSFGFYTFWWIYKAWRFFQQKDKLNIMPPLRTILSLFFLIPLFNRVQNFANQKGYKSRYSSALLFIGFVVGNLLSKLSDPFWLISYFSFVFLIPPFKALNFAKQNSTDFIVNEQSSFNGRQIAIIIIGTICWALLLVGMTIGDV